MYDDLKEQLKQAIERARNWSVDGWPVGFGPRRVDVPSLKAALDSPKTFAHRQEALGYWHNVKLISEDVTHNLEAALAALEKGDLKAVENKLYAAQYMEKPLEEHTKTSKPVYEAFKSL